MSFSTLFEQESGEFITVTDEAVEPSVLVGVLTTETRPDPAVLDWLAVSRSWVPKPNPTRAVVSRKEFLDRFTPTELASAMALRRSNDLAIYGAIESFVLYVTVSTAIELVSPQVIAGLAFLVATGVLTADRFAVIRTPLPL